MTRRVPSHILGPRKERPSCPPPRLRPACGERVGVGIQAPRSPGRPHRRGRRVTAEPVLRALHSDPGLAWEDAGAMGCSCVGPVRSHPQGLAERPSKSALTSAVAPGIGKGETKPGSVPLSRSTPSETENKKRTFSCQKPSSVPSSAIDGHGRVGDRSVTDEPTISAAARPGWARAGQANGVERRLSDRVSPTPTRTMSRRRSAPAGGGEARGTWGEHAFARKNNRKLLKKPDSRPELAWPG